MELPSDVHAMLTSFLDGDETAIQQLGDRLAESGDAALVVLVLQFIAGSAEHVKAKVGGLKEQVAGLRQHIRNMEEAETRRLELEQERTWVRTQPSLKRRIARLEREESE